MTQDVQWYIRVNGKHFGPVSADELKRLAASGRLQPTMEVRRDADDRWYLASNIRNLFPVSPSAQQSVPQPVVADVPAKVRSRPPAFRAEPQSLRRPCPFCGEEILLTAVKCRFCGEYFDGRPAAQQNITIQNIVRAPVPLVKQWDPWVAALMSFFIPGLGQIYKGQILGGICWFIITSVGYLMLVLPGLLLHGCCVIGATMGDPYR